MIVPCAEAMELPQTRLVEHRSTPRITYMKGGTNDAQHSSYDRHYCGDHCMWCHGLCDASSCARMIEGLSSNAELSWC